MNTSQIQWLLDPSTAPGFQDAKVISHLERGPTTHHTEHLSFKVPKRYALVNITDFVQDVLHRSKVIDGYCLVSAMHITAGIYVNDAESGLLNDISKWINDLAPFGKNYLHHQTGEDNGDAHLKSYLTNHEILVPITNGRFDFGIWQQIFYAEFDGCRSKRILVKIMGLTA